MESNVQKPSSVDQFNLDTKEGSRVEGEVVYDNNKVEHLNMEADKIEGFDASFHVDNETPMGDDNLSDPPKSSLGDVIEQRGTKRPNDGELDADNKKYRTDIIISDDDIPVSSSGSSDSDSSDDSDDSDSDSDSDSEIAPVSIR